MEGSVEVLAIIANPDDFPSWPEEQKVRRYERVMAWHDYVEDLHLKGKMPWIWGSHQVIDSVTMSTAVDVRIAGYRVDSLKEFNDLAIEDPLRDVSKYMTIPLSSITEDKVNDIERVREGHERLLQGKDRFGTLIYEAYRSLYRQPPSYVGQYDYQEPNNPGVDLYRESAPGDPIEFMLYGTNPDELIGVWDDTRKMIHYEKVQWWHDYAAMLLAQGHATHVWGNHDFCSATALLDKSAAAVMIIKAQTWDEFDDLYKLDPIRDATRFLSVALRPIADQKRNDARLLELARMRVEGLRQLVTIP